MMQALMWTHMFLFVCIIVKRYNWAFYTYTCVFQLLFEIPDTKSIITADELLTLVFRYHTMTFSQ